MNQQLTPNEQFWLESRENVKAMSEDKELKQILDALREKMGEYRWVYNFSWLGRPMIALPTDMYGFQEIIWKVKPDLIIETGIAHGGSLMFSASMLELLGGDGQVVGIDIDIRAHNRVEIEKHPLYKRITLLEGSSVAPEVVEQVYKLAEGKKSVMVILDSNHTHAHVLAELEAFGKLVTKDSYLVVCDTIVEVQDEHFSSDRPWGKGNNPYTAVQEFLRTHKAFEVDYEIENKLFFTCAPSGWLKKQRNEVY